MTPALLPFEAAFQAWMNARGMTWEPIKLPLASGSQSTTAYRLSPDRPAARIALALHGAGNDALFGWVGLFKRLLEGGTQIVTYDLPGHGRFNDTRFAAEIASESIQSALDACAGDRPGVPIHAIGVSLGGSVLLSSLPHLQERLASAALLVAPLRIHLSGRAIAGEIGLQTFRVVWRERVHYGFTGLIPSFASFKREIYPLRLSTEPPEGTFGYVDALNSALASMQLEDAAAHIRLPVLLVYGGRDRIVPPEQGRRLNELMTGSELCLVAAGTHLSTPLERETTRRLVRWVEAPQ